MVFIDLTFFLLGLRHAVLLGFYVLGQMFLKKKSGQFIKTTAPNPCPRTAIARLANLDRKQDVTP